MDSKSRCLFLLALLVGMLQFAWVKPCQALPGDPPGLRAWSSLSQEEQRTVVGGTPWFGKLEVEGIEGAQALTYVPVSLPAVWKLMTNYESFADWIDGINAITMVTRPQPHLAYVGYNMSAIIRDLHYVLRRREWPRKAQRWTRASGALKLIRGGYDFYPHGASGTIIRFYTIVDPGVWIPGFIRSYFSVKGLQGLIRDIKKEAMRRFPDGRLPVVDRLPVSQALTAPTEVSAEVTAATR